MTGELGTRHSTGAALSRCEQPAGRQQRSESDAGTNDWIGYHVEAAVADHILVQSLSNIGTQGRRQEQERQRHASGRQSTQREQMGIRVMRSQTIDVPGGPESFRSAAAAACRAGAAARAAPRAPPLRKVNHRASSVSTSTRAQLHEKAALMAELCGRTAPTIRRQPRQSECAVPRSVARRWRFCRCTNATRRSASDACSLSNGTQRIGEEPKFTQRESDGDIEHRSRESCHPLSADGSS
jgi:hypothetical protein